MAPDNKSRCHTSYRHMFESLQLRCQFMTVILDLLTVPRKTAIAKIVIAKSSAIGPDKREIVKFCLQSMDAEIV